MTFKDQIITLTSLTISGGTAPTEAQVTQFLIDGVLDYTEKWLALHPGDVDQFQRVSAVSDVQGAVDIGKATQLIAVRRENNEDGVFRECNKISPGMQDQVIDSGSIHLATRDYPVFTVEDNGAINVYPVPAANNGVKVHYVNHEPMDGSGSDLTFADTTIKYFPKNKIKYVVIFAAIKSLSNKLNSQVAEIDTLVQNSLSAGNIIIDTMLELTAKSEAEINAAVSEIMNASSLISSGGDIATAITVMQTAVAKFRADGGDPVLFGDESEYETGVGMTRVNDALLKAQKLVDDAAGGMSQGDDVEGYLADEDIEMVSAGLSIASQELARADAHIKEWKTAVETLTAEITAADSEVRSRFAWVESKASLWAGRIESATHFTTLLASKSSIVKDYIADYQAQEQALKQQMDMYKTTMGNLSMEYSSSFGGQTQGAAQ